MLTTVWVGSYPEGIRYPICHVVREDPVLFVECSDRKIWHMAARMQKMAIGIK